MKKLSTLFFLIIIVFNSVGQWEKIPEISKESFRSIDATQGKRIWAGGSNNTILTSGDEGKSWIELKVGEGFKLDFRGIAAIDANKVLAVSAGLGQEGAAKIYLSEDAGNTWKMTFNSEDTGVFMDGVKFFDHNEGIVYGDPINDKMFLLKTKDGGKTWKKIGGNIPKLKAGEASFAASNSNIFILESTVWIATQDRIFRSGDRGETWEVFETYFPSGSTSGVFGLHFSSPMEGVLVGGDYMNDKEKYPNIAFTQNGGETWHQTQEVEPFGLKEAAWKIAFDKVLVIGTSGTTMVNPIKATSKKMDKESFHSLSCGTNYCFAIGGQGNLAKMRIN